MFKPVLVRPNVLVHTTRPHRAAHTRCTASRASATVPSHRAPVAAGLSVTFGKGRLSHPARSVRMAATDDDAEPNDEIDEKVCWASVFHPV